jgi:hypothetical protein
MNEVNPGRDVAISGRAEAIKVWVDGERVPLTNGEAVVRVDPGQHAISWAVRGAPGTSYSLQITRPREAKLARGDTFNEVGLDVGVAWFTVS